MVTRACYGGAKYMSNGVPDILADGMVAKCKDRQDKLLPSDGPWMPGHWGTYIGDGLAIECTPA